MFSLPWYDRLSVMIVPSSVSLFSSRLVPRAKATNYQMVGEAQLIPTHVQGNFVLSKNKIVESRPTDLDPCPTPALDMASDQLAHI